MRRISLTIVLLCVPLLSGFGSVEQSKFDEMMPLLSDLAERGGYGVRDTEQAAFIVDDGDALRCVLWPFSAEFQKAQWHGPVPENVVAIAHTHPRCCRETSAHDRRQAEHLAMPVIAVSMGTLSSVDESGRPLRTRTGIAWRKHADPEKTCQ